MEMEAKPDDHFADLLAKFYEQSRPSSDTAVRPASMREETVDEELLACLDCLSLIDRVRDRQRLRESLVQRVRQSGTTGLPEFLPRRMGHFEIERELGRGGAGMVVLAIDTKLHRRVAIKIPHPQFITHDELRSRFIREAEASARLDHPHIVKVLEVGQEGPISFIVNEYCDGPSLAQWQRDHAGPIPAMVAATIVRDLAHAVHHAHLQAVLHRDIKPGNVLVFPSGTPNGLPIVKLCDFGLAKLLDEEMGQTKSGDLIGTPAYMAPEQVEGKLSEIDTRTDVYSLGALLFELLTGRPPFEGETRAAILLKVTHQEPPYIRTLRKDVPADLATIVAKCLSKSKDSRYASAFELATDLNRFLDGLPTLARPISVWESAKRWVRRRPLIASALALSAISVIALIATLFATNTQVRQSLEKMRIAEQKAVDEAYRSKLHLYAADVRYAQESLRDGQTDVAREALSRHIPGPGEADLRTWAWQYLWQQSLRPGRLLGNNTTPVIDATISPDGKTVVAGMKRGQLAMWDLSTGKELHRSTVHLGDTTAVRYSPLTGKLWSCGDEGALREWNGETSRAVIRLTPGVKEMAFSVDGKYLATGNQWGQLSIVDAVTGKLIKVLRAHAEVIGCVEFSPDGRYLLSASEDRHVRLWSTVDFEKLAELQLPSKIVSAAFSPDSTRIALALRQTNEVAILRLLENTQYPQNEANDSLIEIPDPDPRIAIEIKGLSADGTTLIGNLTQSQSSRAFRWKNTTGWTPLGSLEGANGTSEATAISMDGTVIVGRAKSERGIEAFRWEESAGMQPLGDLPGGTFFSEAISVSPDGESVWGNSSSDRGTDVFTWTIDGPMKVLPLRENLNLFAISPGGETGLYRTLLNGHFEPGIIQNLLLFTPAKDMSTLSDIQWTCLSPDGSCCAGTGMKNNARESFVWRLADQFHVLPHVGTPFGTFLPKAMSENGSIVVGLSQQHDDPVAMVWGDPTKSDPQILRGFATVKELLSRHGRAKQTEGFFFQSTDAISGDGRSMVGRGINPKGESVSWLVTLPRQQLSGALDKPILGLTVDHFSQTLNSTVLNVRWLDNENVVVGDVKGNLTQLNSSGIPVARHRGHEDRISTIAFDERSGQCLTGSLNGELRLWPKLQDLLSQVALTGCRVASSIEIDPSNEQLIVMYQQGDYDSLDLKRNLMASGHQIDWPRPVIVARSDLSPDGKLLAILTEDRMVSVVDRASDKIISTFETPKKESAIGWTTDSKQIITSSSQIHFWDPTTGQHKQALGKGTTVERKALDVSTDGSWLASSNGRQIELWNMKDRTLSRTLSGHSFTVNTVQFSHDSKWLASTSMDYSVRVWNVADGTCASVLNGHHGPTGTVAWLPDQRTLASSDDEEVLVWDLRSKQSIWRNSSLPQPFLAVASSKNALILLSNPSKTLTIWSATDQP
jgi:serine/threonine protein kinase/WD40 repeat protein